MATVTQVLSPLDIATQGLLSDNILTIATQGWIAFVTEEIIEGGGKPPRPGDRRVIKKKKRITVTCFIDGKKYVETVETKDLTIKLKDVIINVIYEETKPKVIIILPK